jgi:hypothetical protein
MDKAFILSEIKRTAKENGGKALGLGKFAEETGVKQYNWQVYWDVWSSALKEAGFEPNTFGRTHSHETLVEKLIELIRGLGQFPLQRQIVRKARTDSSFPGESSFRKLGTKSQMAASVLAYCQSRAGFEDVVKICSTIPLENKPEAEEKTENLGQAGYVYLWKSHRRYKIGKTFDLDRREGELAAQSPYGWERIHEIKTDDPSGVEAYWHKRFKDKATDRNEWFELSGEDVKAFKRWRNIY